MSFNHHDNNQRIDLGNYEEFFILYMDGELNGEQMKMVDDFLLAHPGLQAEMDMLLHARLPLEDLSFDKESLLSGHMILAGADQDLLLYMDKELPTGRKEAVEQKLVSDRNYRLQYEALLRTQLSADDTITYPHKKELYRRANRRLVFNPWMRAAAAIVLIAGSATLYLVTRSLPSGGNQGMVHTDISPALPNGADGQNRKQDLQAFTPSEPSQAGGNVKTHQDVKKLHTVPSNLATREKNPKADEELVALNEPVSLPEPERPVSHISNLSASIDTRMIKGPIDAVVPGNLVGQTINNSPVTSILPNRTISNKAARPSGEEDIAASNKGSVKGFLRKATRLIEKRTGIDPTNENGELLIGMVAVQLK